MNNSTDLLSNATLPYEKEVNVLCRYILTHPQWQRAFSDPRQVEAAKPSDVINVVLRHLKRGTVRVAQDEKGEIVGIMLFTPNTAEMVIHVDLLIGSDQRIVDAALEAWKNEYPEFSVTMVRHGKNRHYQFSQFFTTSND